MKTLLLSLAGFSALLLSSCASTDPMSSGLPEAANRAEAREYGTPTPLSTDPTSPLHEVNSNKGQVSVKAAEF